LRPETSQEAAKWRAASAVRLAEQSAENPAYRAGVFEHLVREFAALLHRDLGYAQMPQADLEAILRGDMRAQLEAVLVAAMELATVVVRERAGYTLEFPDLKALGYAKAEDDPLLTNCASTLGIDAPGATDEQAGAVAVLGSPRLVKWGSGAGEDLGTEVTLCKAFAWRPGR
jgi:predicted nucleic acid-binding protein